MIFDSVKIENPEFHDQLILDEIPFSELHELRRDEKKMCFGSKTKG